MDRERESLREHNAFLRENPFFYFFQKLRHVCIYIYIYSLIFATSHDVASSARNYPLASPSTHRVDLKKKKERKEKRRDN